MANIINFNDQNTNQNEQQGISNNAQSSSITPVANFNAQQSVPNKSASSGQFTNIQKYLQANKGAGQQVAGAVNQQLDKSLKPGQQQQQDAAKQFAENVQKSNDVLGKGQGFLQQMQQPAQEAIGLLGQQKQQAPQQPQQQANQVQPVSGGAQTQAFVNSPVMTAQQAIAASQPQQQQVQPVAQPQPQPQQNLFNAQSFINDPNQLKQFIQLRTGQGVDENMLRDLATKSQSLAGMSQQQAQELADRTRSAQGRTSLVSESFNRPNYTQGQQRLDNLFLTGAGRQGINAIQEKAKGNVAQAQNIRALADKDVTSSGEIAKRESDLQTALQNQANQLETSYIDQLKGQVGGINTQRQQDQANAANFFNILLGKGKAGETLDQNLFNELGLRQGENTFKVLTDPNLTKEQVFNFSQRMAQNAQDAATQQDVNYYNALAQLSKGQLDQQGNFVAPRVDELQLSKASDLDKAVSALQGDASLRNKLDTAQANFLKDAMSNRLYGYGEDTGTGNIFGGGGTATATESTTLSDFLNNQGQNPTIQNMLSNPGVTDKLSAMLSKIPNGGNALADAIKPMLNPISGLTSIGQEGGSSTAAIQRAQMNLVNSIYGDLINKGYGNYLTTSGNKNVDSLLRNLQAQDVNKAEVQNRSNYGFLGSDPSVKNNYIDSIVKSRSQTPMGRPANLPEDQLNEIRSEAENQYNFIRDQQQARYNTDMANIDKARANILDQIKSTLGVDNFNFGGIKDKYRRT